jgi:voltage-gated potassium channel
MIFFTTRFWRRLRRTIRNRHVKRIAGTVGVVLLCIILNSICFYIFERSVDNPPTLWDSVWLSFTTITTVGYGDHSPTTVGGRLATMILLYLVGLASFPYVITQIVDVTVEGHNDRRYGFIDCRDLVEDHIVIVNFTSELKVMAIIEQLDSDPVTAHREIVILADTIEELPFTRPDIYFVRGSPLQESVLKRANLEYAYVALVLSPKTVDERAADAISASTILLIETLNPQIRTIAECSNIQHLPLFQNFRCDAVIPTDNIAAKVLAQEVRDHGIAPAVSELLTQAVGSELYSEVLDIEGLTFNGLRLLLTELKAQIILVGIIRDNQHLINPPPDLQIQREDRLMLISNLRSDWEGIHAQLLERWKALRSNS